MKIIPALKRLAYSPRQFLARIFSRPPSPAQPVQTGRQAFSIYDLSIAGIDGKEISFDRFKGKKMLLVNTASECGYTPQYKSLQKLHEQYHDKVSVIGFPSNDFGGQEPEDEPGILNFCERNYGVTFPLTKKIDVVGNNQHKIYQWLSKKELNGWNDKAPDWNFCKYLIDENGNLLSFFSKKIDPLSEEIVSKL